MMLRLPRTQSAIVLLLLTLPAATLAQVSPGIRTVQPIPDANDPVERLGRYIRVLAGSPRNLDALLGAGQAALDVGDPNAALGFFARAEEVSPANGAVKAGLGSSLVMIERPDDALRLFAEALALGVPEAAIARDRGLAYDLRGDYRRAQRDYVLAASRGTDDELLRRHALSLGISGNRNAAIDKLEPLLRKQDQGAWRARAFILAMTGDVSGANGIARQLMVPAMASAMAPLLARLATLNPAERAHAVNFGTVPADGTQLAVQTGDPYLGATPPRATLTADIEAAGSQLIPAGAPLGPKPVQVARADPPPLPPRGTPLAATPGFTTAPVVPVDPTRRIGERIGPVDPARLPPEARGEVAPPPRVVVAALPTPAPVVRAPLPEPVPVALLPMPVPAPVVPATPPPVPTPPPGLIGPPVEVVPTSTIAPAFEIAKPVPPPAAPVAAPPVAPVAASPVVRLAGLLDGIERESESAVELPNAREVRAARDAARRKVAQLAAQTAAEDAAKKEREEKAALAKRHPARLWVQVATGRNDSGLALTWRRIRDDHAALKSQTAWSAPFRATNRILVGPMKSAAAARELVNTLAKGKLQANVWSSEAGEEVERLSTR